MKSRPLLILLMTATFLAAAAYSPAAACSAPTVSSMTPDKGMSHGGTVVTITGANFTTPLTVTFATGHSKSVTIESANRVKVVTPAFPDANAKVILSTNCGSVQAGMFRYYSKVGGGEAQ